MRSLRAYQLNDAATRVSAMLKFTRFESVRRNKNVNFLMLTSGTGYMVGTDSDNSGTLDPTEKQDLIAGFATILPSGSVPTPTAIVTALGGTTPTNIYGSPATITFDARGAIRVGGAVSANVFVIYIGSVIDPDPGYRAVILLPGGTTQIWSAPQSGGWQQVG
jgi:Type II transport protein GspH